MEIVVQVLVPAAERWKATEATPLVVSEAFALSVTVARRLAPGATSEPVGLVLSTVIVRVGLVKVLPATSLVTTRRSYEPSVSAGRVEAD